MIGLFFNLIKLVLFVAIILMLGQIPVGLKPIAAHLTGGVLSLWKKEGIKLVEPIEEITGRDQASLRRLLKDGKP